MQIDPDQPWGLALDYAGRAMAPVIEQGLPVDVVVQDVQPGQRNTPTIMASINLVSPDGEAAITLAAVTVYAYAGGTWVPDPLKMQRAVESCAATAVERLQWLASLIPAPAPVETPAP